MKLKSFFLSLLLTMGFVAIVSAQNAVTVGNKVTDASSLVSGNAYLIKYTSMTGTPYIYDAGMTTPLQAPSVQNAATKSCAFYFISDGNGAYKFQNGYTGCFWPAPTRNERLYPTTAANAGSWAVAISSGTATLTCENSGTTYGLDRLTPDVAGWSSRKTVEIYEISAATLSTTAAFTEFTDKDINISATAATSLTTGTWYVMKNIGRNVYAYEKTDAHKLYNQSAAPSGSAEDNAKFLVRLLNGTDGKYYLQNGLGNFVGAIPQNTAVPTTALIEEQISIAQIGDNAGYFYLRGTTDSRILDCQDPGYPVVGWGTDAPTVTNSNAAWQFFPVEFVDSWVPAIDEVYTINNTNSGRGALIYNPDVSTTYVWSSGKGGTFDASQANSQWVIIPSGTATQYFLYSVGAGKFAIPSGIASGAGNPWRFSDNAVAVIFENQGNGTKKIKMANNPVSGTNAAYLSVSNGQAYPIINYNDEGSEFTITKVDGDASAAASAAVAKLVKNQTALTGAVTADDGWYVINIRTTSNSTATASPGRYIYPGTTNQANYPLTFTGGVDVQPSISDATFFTRFVKNGSDYNWQMTNGQYLANISNVFPKVSTEPATVNPGYDNGNYIYASGRYADPYVSSGNFFIGETSYYRTTWNIYPIDLSEAGLVAWQVVCENAPDNAEISCSRGDVKGLTTVYKNGFFFLPTGVTPEEGEFTLEGANGVTIDGMAHTITFAYDPSLALVEGSVTVEQGWQTAGRDSEVMLLKVTAQPFKAATNTTLTVSLKDGSEANISSLKLYEANSSSPEIYSTGDGAPTKTEVATASISGSTATFTIGNIAVGTHYYWIGATVSSTATLGAVLDAAVTGISYQVEGQTAQDLDLTSVGDPADRGAMVFNVRSYPFLPRDNGSRVYRIPAMVVADDGSIVVAADKRYDRYDDIGANHVIDIVVRRSTDGGKTWSEPVIIAKGEDSSANGGEDSRCGFGDPSLVKGKDGKLYCLFAAGNEGYFKGQKGMCMSVSTDNGVTWNSSVSNPPVDLYRSGAIQNATGVGAAGGYGLYDYFVTSGKGLYTSDGILMYLIPAQTLTADNYNTMTVGTYWSAASDDYLFYSTDDGATWYFSQTPMVIGGDEAKVIEMNDGSLFGSIRKGGPRRFNTATYTKNNDGTLNFAFGEQWDNDQLHQNSQNNQDILYYQRETKTGKTDIIFHSITTGNHTNFKLYYSIDQGANWMEFLNVQTKGTRYVTLERGGTEENPGSLYMLFEDQSLNSAGGYTDYNHYPLNFIEITRDQLESLIPTLNDAAKWKPTVSEVYTINNTNSNRGALIYNPDANPNYVWSSGKSGTFDASNANSQWVIIPTGVNNQYYLFNVGAGKFAIPTGIAESASNSWVFSDNAVAVIFEDQADGTQKIKMAGTPVNGNNAAYMAVSNSYTGPIINYNDEGGNFTITKVDGQDQSTAANAAVAKLIKNQTALKSYPQTTGWYVIQIKSKTGAASYADRYLQTASSLYNGLYPLTFTGAIDVQPSITDPSFFTYINCTSWDVNTWQMPDGRYLVDNGSGKFPTPSTIPGNVICGFENGNYFKSNNNWFADPYNSDANYFIGETSYMRTAYTVYPINLEAAGLTAWQVICDAAPESAQITCSRNDVKGLNVVYKNGYFFLPSGVTPQSGDFVLDGAIGASVDIDAKTVTLNYNPDLAIVEEGVTVEQGWQTAGRDSEVMLLRVTAKPFKDAINTTMTVNLKDGSEANISTLKLYEANSSSPEIYSTGDGAPTKTEVATASISGSTATFSIGNLAAGTHYYWIGATVSSTATLGAVLDAAVTSIAYQVEGQTAQDLDLASVGDPADRGAMVFNAHSYPFLPRDNGSRVYRIPAMVVADDGSIVVAADKRYQSHTDIGSGHVIDIVIRRSTDGGKTWSDPIVVAKGLGTADDAKCGYGDPSLVKGKDGKLYCLFVAGNLGYFYGQKRIAMTTSSDNGVTWSSSESTPPIDLLESGRLQNYNTVGEAGYGLYDYFVTSGRGLYIPEDDILMYLIPAQTMTSATEHTGNSQNYIFYSTDGGDKWYFSPQIMYQGGDEAKIIQMNDGSLLGSVRQAYNRGFNTATYTKNNDGTLSFTMGTQWNNSQLYAGGYANNQDIFYYQRETVTGKTDVIIHSMTTGQHANFKLYYSTDQGANWTEFLNVQTKGTRYVTMDRGGSDKNPGSLYLFFEDQSLNSAGGHTDYNHYPLNFLEITREQLESLIPELNEYAVPEYLETNVVKNTVYQTGTGCDSYGAFSGTGTGHWARTWTSNASSGMAGLTVSTESGYGFDKATVLSTRVMTLKPSADGATDTYTITAPAGYLISSYTIGGAVYTGGTYRITAADETTTGDITSTTTPTNITVNDVNASSTTFTFYGASQSNWFAITDFTVTLVKPLQLNVVGNASYATLYLPFDVTTTGATKAYYVKTTSHWKDNDYATLQETTDNGRNIPANTAVVLVNEDKAASTILNMTSGLSSVVTENANLLKGTLVPMSLDLRPESSYYALGKSDSGEIGFYKFDDGESNTITLGANKAYLDVDGAFVKGFAFKFGNEDAIHTIGAGTSRKQQTIYNLAGQRVSRTVRGLYIVDGHKVVVK